MKPARRRSTAGLCIDWNIGEEGGCELLSGEREGSSEHAAIFTSLPPLLVCRMNINAAAHSRIFLQTHF